MLLWIGAVLCFPAYGIQGCYRRGTKNDNLYLGVVLSVVAIITGVSPTIKTLKAPRSWSPSNTWFLSKLSRIRNGEKEHKCEEAVAGDLVEVRRGDLNSC